MAHHITVPYFLRSWVFLLRIKSALKIKVTLRMTGAYQGQSIMFAMADHALFVRQVDGCTPIQTSLPYWQHCDPLV